jgi:4-hydroxy-tetrahydrodipicolinate synthase
MLSGETKGVFVISATPFTDQGEIDHRSVDSLIEFYLEKGVHGITILGMMGEAQKLSFEETETFTEHVLRVIRGRVPVIVGASQSALAGIRALACTAMDAGAAGVLIAPAAGLRSDDSLYEYYAGIFEVLGPGVPVAFQDYPQSTGVFLSAALFGRLVSSFPQLVMLKAEDCPGLRKLSRIRADEEQGQRRVSILVGNGGLYLPQELRRGADGVMTGFAYPEMLVQVYERFVAGDPDGAEDIYDAYLPLVSYEQQPGFGLAVRKEILRRRGAIASAKVRSPGFVMDATDIRELDALQARLERALSRQGRTRPDVKPND